MVTLRFSYFERIIKCLVNNTFFQTGNSFENVEIENGDWCDFDEKNGNSVAISEFKSNFIKVKAFKGKK